MKYESKIDVAVLLIFFSREKPFKKVFEQVKVARPARLYLYQDGPREGNNNDIEGCKKCREIAEDIDWECEVHRFYQEKNVGCDPSEYIAQKWMFETEEMGIVLEDDDVPSQAFFPFCKELLEKYKDDQRINYICGMNNYNVNEETPYSYFFAKKGCIWGWASWRRVIDTWDATYSFLEDEEALRLLKLNMSSEKEYNALINTCKRHRDSGRAHYETIGGVNQYLRNMVNIVPKYNMISNIGIDPNTTHSVSDIRKLPKKIQRLFNKKRYEIQFPLKHPDYLMVDQNYDKKYETTFWEQLMIHGEGIIRKLRYR